MPNASAFSGRGHIPLSYPPLWPAKLAFAADSSYSTLWAPPLQKSWLHPWMSHPMSAACPDLMSGDPVKPVCEKVPAFVEYWVTHAVFNWVCVWMSHPPAAWSATHTCLLLPDHCNKVLILHSIIVRCCATVKFDTVKFIHSVIVLVFSFST